MVLNSKHHNLKQGDIARSRDGDVCLVLKEWYYDPRVMALKNGSLVLLDSKLLCRIMDQDSVIDSELCTKSSLFICSTVSQQ